MTDVLGPAALARTPPRSTGRPPGSVRGAWLVLEAMWAWYRRNWKATVFSSVGLPVVYLLAMGLGFGSQVHGGVSGGVTYLAYVAPALLPAGAVQTAAGESTFPVLAGFAWSKTYFGITVTPITPGQLVVGELLWIGSRLTVSGAVYLVVALAVGAVSGPGIVLSLVFGVCTGLAFAAPLLALAASVNNDGRVFDTVFRFVVLPMSLFAGTFFPVTQLPGWVRPVVWVMPMWHGTELARGAALGTLGIESVLVHLGFLGALCAVGLWLARWRFRVRLTR